MERLLYCNPTVAVHRPDARLQGLDTLEHISNIFNWGFFAVDRTGTIRMPIKTKSLFPIPTMRSFSKTFEEICNERAVELLKRADSLGVKLYTFWSGGIDSTLILVSLLKNATAAQKGSITVVMSEESISENPAFYRDHIRGKLNVEFSMQLPYIIGSKHLIVNGEHNDQVFGSGLVVKTMSAAGASVIHQPYSRALFFELFRGKTGDDAITNRYLDLFERLKDAAPVPIVSNFDYLWWLNFSMKWQTVYARSLSFVSARNAGKVTEEYLRTYYAPFYGTDDFQLWSMNNPDKKMKDTWNTYKWVCKDIIYDYDKNVEYRDTKTKRNSLVHVINQQRSFPFIDDQWHFYETLDPSEYYEPDNDFT